MEERPAQTLQLVLAILIVAAATLAGLIWWSYRQGELERWPIAATLIPALTPAPQSPTSAQGSGTSFSGARVSITGLIRTSEEGEVILTNQGGAIASLAGWRVCKGDSLCFAIPAGFQLPPGASVRIRSGAAKSQEPYAALHWTEDKLWTEPHGLVTLRDASGEVISRFEY